jgi:glycosyltransferase involved in cell wall biosynthesis
LTGIFKSETLPFADQRRGKVEPKIPVHVAYVLPGLAIGGTESQVLTLASRLDRTRFSPSVVSTAGDGPLRHLLEKAGVPVTVLNYPGLSLHPGRVIRLLRETLSFFRDMTDAFRDHGVSVVHAFLPGGNVLGACGAALAQVPVTIVSKRALCDYKRGHPVFSLVEDLASVKARAILVNSKAVARDVEANERGWRGKIRLIYNGVDAGVRPARLGELFPGLAGGENRRVVTYVANFYGYKGHEDLVDAAEEVAREFPDVLFLMVGRDAGAMPAVRDRIAKLGLEKHMLLPGPRADTAGIFAASTLAVHPSHQEGFPNAVLEAMAAGKAVVAAATGGTVEAVEDGRTGILVPPRDPEALAEGLLLLLRDPALAQRMGEAGMARVREEYSLERMVRSYQDLYDELLAGGPA